MDVQGRRMAQLHVRGPAHALLWRDVLFVLTLTIASVLIASHFEFNETLYALTRHGEKLQVDELPIGMLVLTLGLIWVSWKRYADARRELAARWVAEAALAAALAENRKLARENLRNLEVERKRLARELHDELGQYLNAMKLDAVSIIDNGLQETGSSGDSDRAVISARAIIRSIDHVHVAVTDMIGRLRPVGLDELGLVAAVEHCVDHWRERLPATRFHLDVSGDLGDLGETCNLTLFRLVQEGLTNVHKHANAGRVTVDLARVSGIRPEVRLLIADDGRGMDVERCNAGYGVRGMRERTEMAGGTFSLRSIPGQGVTIDVILPIEGSAP